MLTPAYKIIIGEKAVDTTDEPKASTTIDLSVKLDINVPADIFKLVLGQVNGLKPESNDDATIELGYADNGELTQVMKGTVVTVVPGLTTKRVVGHSAVLALLHTFVDKTYESKTAGQIVIDMANQAGVDVAAVEDGINFPAYVIDGHRSLYQHMRDLADLCGFDLYINTENELVFEKFIQGNTIHVFEYAKHIIELDVQRTPLQAGQVESWGESPGGGEAQEAWAWLTKDFSGSKGTAGSGDPNLLLERPVLRTADAARTAAEARFTMIQRRAIRGRLVILGRPEVKLGDAIRLREVPEDDLNDVYQVRAVTHRIIKAGGFTTTVEFQSI